MRCSPEIVNVPWSTGFDPSGTPEIGKKSKTGANLLCIEIQNASREAGKEITPRVHRLHYNSVQHLQIKFCALNVMRLLVTVT